MPAASQRALARRALPEPAAPSRLSPLHRSLAAVAVTALGLTGAASIAVTGHAQGLLQPGATATPQVQVSADLSVAVPQAFRQDGPRADEDDRPVLADDAGAVTARSADLAARTTAIGRESSALAKKAAAEAKAKREAEKRALEANGTPTLPIASGYTIAARFGAVGAWSRYHTGFDFSSAIGTPVHAPTSGLITTAGSGSASGWAGTYVTVQHADGTQTLYAHLSSVSVQVGDRVRGGDVLGKVGMTGRSFGPHLHFEVYPAGVEPGDIYSAVDPQPWLNKLGLRP